MPTTGCPQSRYQNAEATSPEDASHDDVNDEKVKQPRFDWGKSSLSVSGLGGCLHLPLPARASRAFWVSMLVLDYPVSRLRRWGHVLTWPSGHGAWWSWTVMRGAKEVMREKTLQTKMLWTYESVETGLVTHHRGESLKMMSENGLFLSVQLSGGS